MKPCAFVALGTAFTIVGASALPAAEFKHPESQSQRDRLAETAAGAVVVESTSTVSGPSTIITGAPEKHVGSLGGDWAHDAAASIMKGLSSRTTSVLMPRGTSHA